VGIKGLTQGRKRALMKIIVMRLTFPSILRGSLATYIDTKAAVYSVHSAAPQLPDHVIDIQHSHTGI